MLIMWDNFLKWTIELLGVKKTIFSRINSMNKAIIYIVFILENHRETFSVRESAYTENLKHKELYRSGP
jgi:hypothetical protein